MHFVGKIIAVGPGGKAQAPARSDHFRGVIDAVRAAGWLGRPLLSPACRNHEHADEVRMGLYRSARYYCSCGARNCTRAYGNIEGCPDGGQRISARADVVTVTGDDGTRKYHVEVRFFDKAEATRAVVAKYGPDPSRWPYQAKAKRTREGSHG